MRMEKMTSEVGMNTNAILSICKKAIELQNKENESNAQVHKEETIND